MFRVKVKLKVDFLVVKETLERIGICNKDTKVITPSCYIYHTKGNYYITHFKNLLAMDGFRKDINNIDVERQNAIVTLLVNWGMVEIDERDYDDVYQEPLNQKIYVLKRSEKSEYTINHKYKFNKKSPKNL